MGGFQRIGAENRAAEHRHLWWGEHRSTNPETEKWDRNSSCLSGSPVRPYAEGHDRFITSGSPCNRRGGPEVRHGFSTGHPEYSEVSAGAATDTSFLGYHAGRYRRSC